VRRALVGLGLLLFSTSALSHDWIGEQARKNRAGMLCCGEHSVSPSGIEHGDCYKFRKDEVTPASAGFVFPGGELVPYSEPAPSEDEYYWICRSWDKTRRCTFAPNMGY